MPTWAKMISFLGIKIFKNHTLSAGTYSNLAHILEYPPLSPIHTLYIKSTVSIISYISIKIFRWHLLHDSGLASSSSNCSFWSVCIRTNTSAIPFWSLPSLSPIGAFFPEIGTNSYFPSQSLQLSKISLNLRINSTTYNNNNNNNYYKIISLW